MKKSERTRQRIVEAAQRLFYHQGYHNTSFSDLVRASGVARGNIHYHFRSKEALLAAAIELRAERIRGLLDEWSGLRTPIERLHRFVDLLDETAGALVRHGCPMGTLAAELGKTERALQARAEGLFRLFEEWLADQFAELGYAGRAGELAQRVMAIAQGAGMLAHVHGDRALLHRESRQLRRWIDQLAEGTECL